MCDRSSAESGAGLMHRRHARLPVAAACLLLGACGGGGGDSPATPDPGTGTPPPVASAPRIGSCPAFPPSAVFNTKIAQLPVHPSNTAWMDLVSAAGTRDTRLHADWGTQDDPAQTATYYGIPFNLVGGSAPASDWPSVSFEVTDPRAGNGNGVAEESDCALAATGGGFELLRDCSRVAAPARRFPYPRDDLLKAENGNCNDARTCGDRHLLVVEQGACRLWESYSSYKLSGQWFAYSTAAWDLNSNAMRPDGWTSGDAAGLPILPLLVRVGEADSGEIRHAFRVTLRDSVLARSAVWPARHAAGGATAGGIPFGALMRLKQGFAVPADWTPQAKRIANAMKTYGLYVADIGSDLYVQGEPSAAWDPLSIEQLRLIHASQFEFVDLGAIERDARFSADSFQASW